MMQSQFWKHVLSLALFFWLVCPMFSLERPPDAANLVVNGLLVCLDGTFKETACGTMPELLGLKVAGGTIYPLKEHENVQALFLEKRLQTRQFRLTLRKDDAASPLFELVKSQLIRGGKLYDFHYFCEVCNITTHAPGPCMCCRETTEYRESLAE
ncbi:MAG: hypothetical protein L0312_02085 [Acidobacteria bacterium]|nr:hypothetical protein [Acidobacteriota bacterium]